MTNQQIPVSYTNHGFINGETKKATLTTAIQKAIDGGYNMKGWTKAPGFMWHVELDNHGEPCLVILGNNHEFTVNKYEVIFSHNFAKALWGEQRVNSLEGGWRWHLQNMVIADDPIKYLGEHI
jgi:hypothetical protein